MDEKIYSKRDLLLFGQLVRERGSYYNSLDQIYRKFVKYINEPVDISFPVKDVPVILSTHLRNVLNNHLITDLNVFCFMPKRIKYRMVGMGKKTWAELEAVMNSLGRFPGDLYYRDSELSANTFKTIALLACEIRNNKRNDKNIDHE